MISNNITALFIRAKTNILNETERIAFTTNEYSNILSVFSINLRISLTALVITGVLEGFYN